ncbi:MAG: hypothetical protein JNM63_07570 [Spirochaetia bacterium]|nr:hypothetical protein [Spirochaetia bacterium]
MKVWIFLLAFGTLLSIQAYSARIALIDFEDDRYKELLEWTGNGSAEITTEKDLVIEGKRSLLIDSKATAGEWHIAARSKAGLFKLNHVYTVNLKCRVLELSDKIDSFYFITRPLSTNTWAPLRPEKEVGMVKSKNHWFVADTYGDMSLQLGIRKQGRAVIDSIEIIEENRLSPELLLSGGQKAPSTMPYEPFGVCLHADRVDDTPFGYTDELLDRAFDMWKDLGVQWVRIGLGKNFSNREGALTGDFNPRQTARTDKLMKGLKERGIKFYVIFSAGHVPWFQPPKEDVDPEYPVWAYPTTNSEDYRLYVETIAKRYAKSSDYWEIGNEMDWEFWAGTPELYVKNLRVARETLKKYNPNVRIIMGGLANDGIVGEKKGKDNFLQRLYDSGLKSQTDILAFHLYQMSVERNIYQLNRSISIMTKNGDAAKPVWITETSRTIWNSDEETQANYLRDTYTVLAKHPQIEKIFWWNFKSLKAKPDRETGLALVDTNLSPRKSFYTFKDLPRPKERMTVPEFLVKEEARQDPRK